MEAFHAWLAEQMQVLVNVLFYTSIGYLLGIATTQAKEKECESHHAKRTH